MIKTEIIEALIPLKDPALISMLAYFAEIHHYKKNERIYDVGDMQTKIYLLWSGILRCYFIDELQTDITDCFMTERGLIANSPEVFYGRGETPSVVGVEALTDAMICEIPVQRVFMLMKQYPEMAGLYIHCLHQALDFQNEINNKRLYLSGSKCYEWFCEKWPEVDQIASNHQIATFLGIRSESLSRLRRQKKKNIEGVVTESPMNEKSFVECEYSFP